MFRRRDPNVLRDEARLPWLVRLRFWLAGRSDGRRGLPEVTDDTVSLSPVLDSLARQHDRVLARLVDDQLAADAEVHVTLAALTDERGDLTRAKQRLEEMKRRLDRALAAGVDTGPRRGEHMLAEETVRLRRGREYRRRVHHARKRVEDEVTAVAQHDKQTRRLEEQLRIATVRLQSRARALGSRREAQATAYLSGAIRTHPDPLALSRHQGLLRPDNRWLSSRFEVDAATSDRSALRPLAEASS